MIVYIILTKLPKQEADKNTLAELLLQVLIC